METWVILIFGLILLVMYICFLYNIEKSDIETQKYLDKHYHEFGDWYIRNN